MLGNTANTEDMARLSGEKIQWRPATKKCVNSSRTQRNVKYMGADCGFRVRRESG